MRDTNQILAEVLDSLIKHDSGRIPSEVGELLNLGLRIHNECPDADPAFTERLWLRLQREWDRPAPRPLIRCVGGLLGGLELFLQRAPRRGLAVVVLLLAVTLSIGLAGAAQAGLSRTLSVFRVARVSEQPRVVATAPAVGDVEDYSSLEETRLLAGFPVRVPTYLPEGIVFDRAELADLDGRRRVLIYYKRPATEESIVDDLRNAHSAYLDHAALVIQEYPVAECAEGAPITIPVPEGSTEHLEVAGRLAVFVKGAQSHPSGRARSSPGGILLVEDDEIFVHIWSSFEREELIRIAESMFADGS